MHAENIGIIFRRLLLRTSKLNVLLMYILVPTQISRNFTPPPPLLNFIRVHKNSVFHFTNLLRFYPLIFIMKLLSH
jgi:hypothetical protein